MSVAREPQGVAAKAAGKGDSVPPEKVGLVWLRQSFCGTEKPGEVGLQMADLAQRLRENSLIISILGLIKWARYRTSNPTSPTKCCHQRSLVERGLQPTGNPGASSAAS